MTSRPPDPASPAVAPQAAASAAILDAWARPLRNLRLSVTDRCNIRCQYCMPEPDYVWLPKHDILRFEEISGLVDLFSDLGVDRVRLTGGEPLLRRDLPDLVSQLAAKPVLKDLALTTNGLLLADQAQPLRAAGLHRVTVSLDTLQPARFEELTRSPAFDQVLEGIAVAGRHFSGLKLDTVVIRGLNDDELVPLLEYAGHAGAEIRFIEYMDVGGATRWTRDDVVGRLQILERLSAHYGDIEAVGESSPEDVAAPADRFRLPDGRTFGIISSTTQPFCAACDRSRLTADGMWYLCLYAAGGLDLRAPLRTGMPPDDLRAMLREHWRARQDRGAETRLALADRTPLIPIDSLRKDPHLEMHTRGG